MKELKLKNSRLDGRYDIIDCLGRGSYSEIYRARMIKPTSEADREVVIKALNVFLQGTPEADLERTLIENFQNEALALDRVRHPNIIRRLGHGTALDMGGQPFHYLVLEYMPGGDLYNLCRDTPFRLENALYYLEQVCAGLAHAHACGIIHRDIKPQNLLLTADRRTVKIADFGVAKLNITDEQITRVGTNVYAPPEHSPETAGMVLENGTTPQRLTLSADVYSLAKTLYTLLAGESPRRYAHHPIEALPASLMAQSWGPGLLRVLRRATQTSPADRQQDVRIFWQDVADAVMQTIKTAQTPPTLATPARHNISRELSKIDTSVSSAPPRPRFESATALRDEILPEKQSALNPRARVVVPVGTNENQPARPPVLAVPDVIERLPDTGRSVAPRGLSGRNTRILVALALVAIFVSMLLATNYYVKNYWNKNNNTRNRNRNNNTPNNSDGTTPVAGNPPTKPSPTPSPAVSGGTEGTAATDVNLRFGPSQKTKPLGTIGKGSRVRVLKTTGGWAEIQVLEYVAPLGGNTTRAEDGWVNLKNITFGQ